ncbi:hypothetical protein HN51_013687 [Arachis hypogaea]
MIPWTSFRSDPPQIYIAVIVCSCLRSTSPRSSSHRCCSCRNTTPPPLAPPPFLRVDAQDRRREERVCDMVMVRMKRRRIIASLGFLMLMGVAVYFRLWAIHYSIFSDDSDLLSLPSNPFLII